MERESVGYTQIVVERTNFAASSSKYRLVPLEINTSESYWLVRSTWRDLVVLLFGVDPEPDPEFSRTDRFAGIERRDPSDDEIRSTSIDCVVRTRSCFAVRS